MTTAGRLTPNVAVQRRAGLLCDTFCSHRQTKVFLDVFRQRIVDLVVARHWLLLSSRWIVVNIVAPTVTQKNTTLLLDLADQLATLHSAISFVL